ncbi:hypothetical protein AXF42_Ash011386 [Apostasia shenzhenica]|uniref:Diacylglycerol O-acyltransferase 3, cytosolic n=1 Tax=Apostasia shenzhenica TaxID=1088818 RepID=A0A2I0AEH5_9ASPA|nr:hypothetical protein AXF42_Ash011386 [Apostasia shenzhenica]
MEASGAVFRRSIGLRSDNGEASLLFRKVSDGYRRRSVMIGKSWRSSAGFADDGHRLYYAVPTRCGGGGGVDGMRKEGKRRESLEKELSRELSVLYSTRFGVDGGEGITGELRAKMIAEAAEQLLAQLKELNANEKELKKKKKQEKESKKAAKMACAEEESSSSSSSESSDSDCDETFDLSRIRTDNVQDKLEGPPILPQLPECNEEPPTAECEAIKNIEQSHAALFQTETIHLPETKPKGNEELPGAESKYEEKIEQFHGALELDQAFCLNNSISSYASVVPTPLDKIEVCVGGKCKKSGAMELLQEFEKKIGIEGAVVGCKCMGKCRQGPNVRVMNHNMMPDELGETPQNPLCIGVGLDDVGTIVANFFSEKDVGLLAAA